MDRGQGIDRRLPGVTGTVRRRTRIGLNHVLNSLREGGSVMAEPEQELHPRALGTYQPKGVSLKMRGDKSLR